MTADRLFNRLATYLRAKVEANGGIFAPSETVAETMGMLAVSPVKWRCILQWQREDDTGARGEMAMKLLVIVQQAKGLDVDKGADVTITKAGGKDALLKRFHQVAGWVRAIRWTNADVSKEPMKLMAAYWLNDPSFPTRQIAGEFGIKYGLEAVTVEELTIP